MREATAACASTWQVSALIAPGRARDHDAFVCQFHFDSCEGGRLRRPWVAFIPNRPSPAKSAS